MRRSKTLNIDRGFFVTQVCNCHDFQDVEVVGCVVQEQKKEDLYKGCWANIDFASKTAL